MVALKAVIATVVAVGFVSAAGAGNSTYAGGPKGSSAVSAVRAAPTVADSYASMNSEPVRSVVHSPSKSSGNF